MAALEACVPCIREVKHGSRVLPSNDCRFRAPYGASECDLRQVSIGSDFRWELRLVFLSFDSKLSSRWPCLFWLPS